MISLVDHHTVQRTTFVNMISKAKTEALADSVSIVKRLKAFCHAEDAVAIFDSRHSLHSPPSPS